MVEPIDAGRIRAALTEPTTSNAATALLEELRTAVAAAGDEIATLRRRALDPLAEAAQVRVDREAGEALTFERDRMAAAVSLLDRRVGELRGAERTAAAGAERAAALAERDALAERLRDRWPALEAELVELLSAIDASDARLKRAAPAEVSAEAIARGCDGLFRW